MKDSFASDQQPDLTNKDNFDWIFREHYLMLMNYAWQYVFEQSIAEDIVQDVFIHLWERRHSLQLKVSIKSYLYTSVYNRCLNHIKHEKVSLKFKKVKSDEDKIKQAYYDNLSANKEKYIDSDFIQKVKQTISELPEQQQRVFILSRKFNLKNKEIAEFLNISVKAVEKNMSKALQFLRNQLKNIQVFITI